MSDAIAVQVTADDILHGEARECFTCPVALALQRATGDDHAQVVEIDWQIHFEVWGRYIQAPDEVWRFVRDFDGDEEDARKAAPFAFELPDQDDSEWKEQCYGCEELVEQSEVDDEGYCLECATKLAAQES